MKNYVVSSINLQIPARILVSARDGGIFSDPDTIVIAVEAHKLLHFEFLITKLYRNQKDGGKKTGDRGGGSKTEDRGQGTEGRSSVSGHPSLTEVLFEKRRA